MSKIRLLDEHVANQIAAGEVVERPASVVKELIENAIDAGATTIDIEVEEGGLSLVRVTDNGHGIAPDDIELAFQRHATSKIRTGQDLFRIVTLGFRGEALPSIAAVARVSCRSAIDDSGLGVRLDVEGGRVVRREETAAPMGTDITVRDLFYNTPARLKYMRTVQTELSHVSDAVYRQALTRPDIAFSLRHNGTTLLRTPGNGDLRQVVAAIYGTAAARAMVDVTGDHPDYAIGGLTALPVETRSNRGGITIVVNGRHVRSPVLVQALLQAYHTLLPVNRYPLSVLHLRMHPSLLDVNVHPSKLEVRFSKEPELRAFVEASVREALRRQAYIPSGGRAKRSGASAAWVQEQLRFAAPPPAEPSANGGAPAAGGTIAVPPPGRAPTPGVAYAPAGASPGSASPRPARAELREAGAEPYGSSGSPAEESAPERAASRPTEGGATERPATGHSHGAAHPVAGARGEYDAAGRNAEAAGPDRRAGTGRLPDRRNGTAPVPEEVWRAAFAAPAEHAPPAFPELHWVGQVHGTYIVAQNDTGLFLIDQHAAHERIQYEYFYDRFSRPPDGSQELLLPATLEFAPDEAAVLRDKLPVLASVGVYVEEFGGNTFIVRAVPHWFPQGEEAALVREMVEWIVAERTFDLARFREKAAILCACKAAIKANQALTREAGQKLLERLGACRQPYTCPHGRPIVVSFSRYELDKMFKRVMT